MSDLLTAARQALEALEKAEEVIEDEYGGTSTFARLSCASAITALRQAIEQAQQRKPLTDEECDAVMLALDDWARDVDHYEYGLPIYNEELKETAREVIRAAHGIGGGE